MVVIQSDTSYSVMLFTAKRVSWHFDLRTNVIKRDKYWTIQISSHSEQFHNMEAVRAYADGAANSYKVLKGIDKNV